MHDPREPHFAALKRIMRYSAKRQHTISRSSAKAEYRGVANVVTETAWIRNLLRELHSPLLTATLVYCDNVSAVYMSANPVQHQRTKHIEIDIHFVRDMVKAGHVRVLHVPSSFQYADIFTKGLPSALFEDFRSNLSEDVRCLATLVRSFKLIEVYIEHGVMAVDSYRRLPPRVRATIKDITDEPGSNYDNRGLSG
ncbi:ribonuclease H-like domain-containing protein [Tanacetum coccineum]